MVTRISRYDKGYCVVSFAKDDNTKAKLSGLGLQYVYLQDGCLVFYPGDYKYELDEESYAIFNDSCNYDVFEISIDGRVHRYYSNDSFENVILVTNQCNSNCIMCPTPEEIRRQNETYNAEMLINLIKHIPSDAPHLTITGGEPFMIKKDMFPVLKYLRDHLYDTVYLLLTNGRVFCSKEYSELFKETRPPKLRIGIPIHGYNSSTHDSIVQSKGAFEETISGIKNLLSTEAIIEIRIVVSKLNYQFITEICKLIVREFPGIFCVKIMGLEMTGNAAKNADKVWIDYPTAFNAAKDGINLLIKSGIDVGLYNFPVCAVDSNYWNICEKSISSYKIRYAPECDKCLIKDACGGMFAGTFRLAKYDVKPVEGK